MFTRIALLLIAIFAVPYYWFLMDPGPTSVSPRDIDIARLRALASSEAGALPVAIEFAAVATDTVPGTILVAGGGLRSERTGVFVWRLITPGGDTIINSGLTRDQATASGFGDFHPAIQATADSWLQAARRIIFTSEEIDHVGGLIAMLPTSPDIAEKVIGNPQQVDAVRALAPVLTKSLSSVPRALIPPDGYAAIAPGIAAVRTPGHLGGSQMIYVRLQDGREFLWAGDTAPMRRNVEWQRPRSRYSAEWQGNEDRTATLGWIKGLVRLQKSQPGLKIIYGHDYSWLSDPVMGPRFTSAPASELVPPEGKLAR
ncbi:hypothetical protein [Novosphingobium sp.]|uniref:hypothetical protein n=1 Tax=Novosphingobium sp. TaxID=1874826 RepID=UPI002603BD60|nr:hypothetical protein [Novosphingobium sp.]